MNTFSDILHYVRIYRRYIGQRIYLVFALAILAAFTQGLGFTMLLPLLRVSQSTTNPEELSGAEEVLYNTLAWMGIADSLVGVLLVISGLFLMKGALQFARVSYIGYLQADLLKQLKTGFFDAYNGMTYRYFITQNAGHFINVINGQVRRLYGSFKQFANALTKAVSAFTFFAFAFAVNWRFALMVLALGVGVLFLFQFLNAYVRSLSRRVSSEMSRLNKLLVQSLQAFKYVMATKQTDQLRTEVDDSIGRLTGDIFRQRMAGALTKSIRQPISVVVITGVILIQALVFDAPLAPIFVALLLFHKGMQAIMGLQKMWQSVMDKVGSVEVVDEEMRQVQKNQERSGSRRLRPFSRGIEFQSVCFAYDDDGDVLHDVNISVPANQTVALVGESGAGKSTLVDMMTLMLKPRTGTVEIDGVPHDEVDLGSWRKQIGYVSQETVVFDDTVANNISLWQGDIDEDPALRERVIHAAKRAHAHYFIQDLPDGYQTVVGDRGVRLSGGQRQRLFVARELFKQPNLLLLDEATSDLDTASEQHIQDSIDALQGEVTVVIIAHRLSTVKNADRVYVLDEGRVIEEGSYEELRMRENGEFREMVEIQSL
ncbi:ABC transporter ATP-binding protein [Salinibacter ruber]|uniref:ABC transporter ATP-binding protein n=1 Tax=Salinibacter ruber TaxID=146919 RepID=UPI002072EB09|nr:ABC transporter ATP-binding protein [Salinibacter ruber]MCS4114581.1 ABC-type multidrug transport system fused ATPase/permease subunit [Salinibacter ruber]MCS4181786.1 ABC-type multidrug transport system fused ATPase/permease subunit [Salinibacter ruber]